jgi:hypothetical protein
MSDRIEIIERKIDDAARSLHSILLGDCEEHMHKAHDAINALAAARLQLGLLAIDPDRVTPKGAWTP